MGIRMSKRAGLLLIALVVAGSVFTNCGDNGISPLREEPPQFILQWGKRLNVDGRLMYPGGVATDLSGSVYVIDSGHGLIQVYSGEGLLITNWTPRSSDTRNIAVDSEGVVYLETYNLDLELTQLNRFTFEGQDLGRWPFSNITGLASGHTGCIYINGVQIDDRTGRSLGSGVWKVSHSGEILAWWRHIGSGPITVDGNGNLYLLSNYILEGVRYATVEKFSGDGLFMNKWAVGEGGRDYFNDIAADSEGDIYLTHQIEEVIYKYDTNGRFLVKWSYLSPNHEPLRRPIGIAVDAEDKLYVSDTHDRIVKFGY